jgi:hypothetical protein
MKPTIVTTARLRLMNRLMRPPRRRPLAALMCLATTVLIGCATVTGPASSPSTSSASPTISAATASPPGPTGPSAGEIDMCALMPLSDVQAKSPFQTPLADATSDVVPAGCTYRAALDAEEPVSIGLVATEFDSPADAITVLHNDRQAVADRGLPLSDITGLGDEAFSSGSDEVSVWAVVGAIFIEAHLKGEWPDTPDDAKVVAGTELVRTIISRLP